MRGGLLWHRDKAFGDRGTYSYLLDYLKIFYDFHIHMRWIKWWNLEVKNFTTVWFLEDRWGVFQYHLFPPWDHRKLWSCNDNKPTASFFLKLSQFLPSKNNVMILVFTSWFSWKAGDKWRSFYSKIGAPIRAKCEAPRAPAEAMCPSF